MDWIAEHWLDIMPLVLMAAGIWWLMPRAQHRSKAVGIGLAAGGIALLAVRLHGGAELLPATLLFWAFASAAILFAILMITSRNPVYSALWFAMVTLNTCGLFWMRSAPFLAAATLIVYAGAIVVTFVFVIMLAQQSGATAYDQRARQPIVATIAAFVVLAMILGTLKLARDSAGETGPAIGPAAAAANPLSRPPADQPLASMRGLGRSLFGDYLFAVELAGTLLLVATIGAIAIAPRRRRGTL